jgi:hypothetical protein
MEPFVIDLTVAALAVFAVLLGYGLAASWWHALRDARPLPFFDLVREVGLSPGEAREAVGSSALAFAARRCAFCAAGGDCSGHLANGACPNSRLFAVLRQPRV